MDVQSLDDIAQDHYKEPFKGLWLEASKLCIAIQCNQIAMQRNRIERERTEALKIIAANIK